MICHAAHLEIKRVKCKGHVLHFTAAFCRLLATFQSRQGAYSHGSVSLIAEKKVTPVFYFNSKDLSVAMW